MQKTVKAATLFTAVAAALIFTGHAEAATDLGSIGNYKTFDAAVVDGAFRDFFNFTVDTRGKATFALTGVQLAPTVGVTFDTAQLYAGNFAQYSMLNPAALIATGSLGSDVTDPTRSVIIHSLVGNTTVSLTPNTTYTLYVAGNSGGPSSYVGIIAMAPVPEPETYAMLLAGLGMIGSLAQRRRKSR